MMRSIAIWLLAFAAGSLVIQSSAPELKYLLQHEKYPWLGQRLFQASEPLDTVFIGSSKIWIAVDSDWLDSQTPGRTSLNLAVNGVGRDLDYVIARDAIRHGARRVVLEFGAVEDEQHPNYLFVAGPEDLFDNALSWPPPRDALTLSPQFTDAVERWSTLAGAVAVKGYVQAARWLWHPHRLSQPYANWQETRGHLAGLPALRDGLGDNEPAPVVIDGDPGALRAVRHLTALCKQHDVDLVFLFVPTRAALQPGRRYATALAELGRVIIFDLPELGAASFWRDPDHLNDAGAALFTRALAQAPGWRE